MEYCALNVIAYIQRKDGDELMFVHEGILNLLCVAGRDIAQAGDLRNFRAKWPMTYIDQTRIQNNDIGISTLHYNRYVCVFMCCIYNIQDFCIDKLTCISQLILIHSCTLLSLPSCPCCSRILKIQDIFLGSYISFMLVKYIISFICTALSSFFFFCFDPLHILRFIIENALSLFSVVIDFNLHSVYFYAIDTSAWHYNSTFSNSCFSSYIVIKLKLNIQG